MPGVGGQRREVGVDIKGILRDPGGDENDLYLACMDVSILAMTLCRSFARCSHRRKTDQGFTGCLCVFCYNCMRIYNYLKIKTLNL